MREKILVVDDSRDTREIVARNLSKAKYEVITVESVDDAIYQLTQLSIDLVITDLKMPHKSGMELIKHVKENHPHTEVMLITGYPSLENAVQAVKIGAEDYIIKPFTDEELLQAVKESLKKQAMVKDGNRLDQTEFESINGIIGKSPPMREVYGFIKKAASNSATVLITGESGTGKELVARAIHYGGSRNGYPFVAVNCSAIPDNLLESELFGYLKGAFTGADSSRAGFFQTADRGTIFLDEISEMNMSMQAKLLRVLQEKEIMMLGDRKSIPVDVRIVSSTNKNLKRAVQQGTFREDLFYRLHVLPLEMPPLRMRGNDIILLANYFRNKFSRETGKTPPEFTDSVLKRFMKYEWPGNVRELENSIHRMVVMNESGKIDVTELPEHMRFDASECYSEMKTLAEMEREYIKSIVARVGGNKTKAAQILDIDRKTLRVKLGE